MGREKLRVKVAGVEFKNPIFASAGDPTINAEMIKKSIAAGVGAVNLKTISLDPQSHIWCRGLAMFLDKYGERGASLLLSPGLAFKSPAQMSEIVKEIKPLAEKERVILIGSVQGTFQNPEEWADLAKGLQENGVDLVELIFVCPVPAEEAAGEEATLKFPEGIRIVLDAVKDAVNIPVIAKTRGETEMILRERAAVIDGRADIWDIQGIVLSANINVETGKPFFPTSTTYGPHLKGHATYGVSISYKISKTPIISSSGIFTWRDAVERMMAGARLVGIHSAVRYRGFKVYSEVIDGIEEFLDRKGYKSVEEIIGIAAPYMDNVELTGKVMSSHVLPKEKISIGIDPEKCDGCKRCTVCIFDAISVYNGLAEVDLEKCDRCGVCVSLCPKDAIIWNCTEEGITWMQL